MCIWIVFVCFCLILPFKVNNLDMVHVFYSGWEKYPCIFAYPCLRHQVRMTGVQG